MFVTFVVFVVILEGSKGISCVRDVIAIASSPSRVVNGFQVLVFLPVVLVLPSNIAVVAFLPGLSLARTENRGSASGQPLHDTIASH